MQCYKNEVTMAWCYKVLLSLCLIRWSVAIKLAAHGVQWLLSLQHMVFRGYCKLQMFVTIKLAAHGVLWPLRLQHQ